MGADEGVLGESHCLRANRRQWRFGKDAVAAAFTPSSLERRPRSGEQIRRSMAICIIGDFPVVDDG